MRFPIVIPCLAMGLLPQIGLAADPPGAVGALHAVYDFCTKADPSQSRKFERSIDELFKGLSPARIAALQQSAEYKRGYHVIAGVLPEVKGEDAVAACQALPGVPSPPPGLKEPKTR